MAIAHVQDVTVKTTGTSAEIEIDSTAGNLLVLYVSAYAGETVPAIDSVTDSAGNDWEIVAGNGEYWTSGGYSGLAAAAYCPGAAAVTHVTVTLSESCSPLYAGVSEFSGVAAGAGLDGSGAVSVLAAADDYTTPAITTAAAADVVVAVLAYDLGFTAVEKSAGSATYTLLSMGDVSSGDGAAWGITDSAGSQSAEFTGSTSQEVLAALIFAVGSASQGETAGGTVAAAALAAPAGSVSTAGSTAGAAAPLALAAPAGTPSVSETLPPVSDLQDAFAGGSLDTSLWTAVNPSQISWAGGLLTISSVTEAADYGMLTSNGEYDAAGSAVYVQLVSAGNQDITAFEAALVLSENAGNTIAIAVNGSFLIAQQQVAGTYTTLSSVAYDAAAMGWLRLREESGTVYWGYSATGSEWTEWYSAADPVTLTAVTVSVEAGTYSDESGTTSAEFANLNIPGFTASGAVAPLTLTAPAGTPSAGASAAGAPAQLALTAPAGTVSAGATIAGPAAGAQLAAPAGTPASGTAGVAGAVAPLALAAPAGTAKASVPFPGSPLGVTVELSLAGTWTPITGYVQQSPTTPIGAITRGRPDEKATSATPSALTMKWDNRSGRFSPRNPAGPYYGTLAVRNQLLRVSVPGAGTSLRMEDDTGSGAQTAGVIGPPAGDLDVRVEYDLSGWWPCTLAGMAETSPDTCLSWVLVVNPDGTAALWWSTEGTQWDGGASSTVPLPLGHMALRVTRAYSTGVLTFYTAPDIGGTWTQLGAAVTAAAGAAYSDIALPVTAGAVPIGSPAGTDPTYTTADAYTGPSGRIYALEVISGIFPDYGTTTIASPDFTAETAGTASFTDDQSNTWAPFGTAALDDRSYRAHLECSSLPQEWDPSGSDVWTPVTASGVLRRLQQGSAPLSSALRRYYTGNAAALGTLAYWPGEDNAGSSSAASAVPSVAAMMISGTCGFQGEAGSPEADEVFACSCALAQPGSSVWTGYIPAPAVASDWATLQFLFGVPSGGLDTSGALVTVTTDIGAQLEVVYLDESGGELALVLTAPGGEVTTSGGPTGINGAALLVRLSGNQGDSVTLETLAVDAPGADATSMVPLVIVNSGLFSYGTMFRTLVVNAGGIGLGSAELGHLLAGCGQGRGDEAVIPDMSDFAAPLSAWNGETAAARLGRLAAENGLQSRIYGWRDLTCPMGPQPIDTLANLFQYTEDSDRGQVFEPRECLGIGYRTLASLAAQAPQVSLDYGQGQVAPPLSPTDDDQYTCNDVSLNRNNGASVQALVTTGPMSTAAPPDGAGDYNTTLTTYNAWDKDLAGIASWMTWVGTCDEERYPVISVDLASTDAGMQALIPAVRGLDIGDYLAVTFPEGTPAWLPPGGIAQLAWGLSEQVGDFIWRIAVNAVPESPYEVAVAGSENGAGVAHAQPADAVLTSGVPAGDSPLEVTAAGNVFSADSADCPFGILVAGEQMTVTGVTGTTSPQLLAVTRAVNGVVKAQVAGAAVVLAQTPVAALAGAA